MIIFVRVMFLPPLWQTRRKTFFSPIGSKQAWNNEKGSKNNMEILRPVEVIKAFLWTLTLPGILCKDFTASFTILVDFRSSIPQESVRATSTQNHGFQTASYEATEFSSSFLRHAAKLVNYKNHPWQTVAPDDSYTTYLPYFFKSSADQTVVVEAHVGFAGGGWEDVAKNDNLDFKMWGMHWYVFCEQRRFYISTLISFFSKTLCFVS